MKKSELVDMFLEIHREPNKADMNRGLVSRAISMALNAVFFEIFSKDTSNLADYLLPYNIVPVKHNSEVSIITLPINTLQFPTVGDSIRISSETDTSLMFVPIKIGEVELLGDVRELDTVIPFTVKNDKVWLYGLQTISSLLVELIPEFHELDDDHKFKIPSGVDIKLMESVREILNIGKN